MPLDSQQLQAKLKAYPTAVGCILAAIAFFAVYWFRQDVVPELEKEAQALDEQVALMEDNTAAAANLDTHIEQLQAQVTKLESRLMDSQATTANQQYFFGMERAAGVTMEDPLMSSRPPGGTPGIYQLLRYQLAVRGTFPHLLEMMYALQFGERFVRIRSFEITRSAPTEPENLALRMDVEVLGK